jgi:hypothetical protein
VESRAPLARFIGNVRVLCAHRFLEFNLDTPFGPSMKAGDFRLCSALADVADDETLKREAA